MCIERCSQIKKESRLDDVGMTDDSHRFLPVLPSQILQRVRHTRLDLQHQFSFGCVCDASQCVESGPMSVTLEIRNVLALPRAEIDFVECVHNADLLTEPAGEWLSRFPSPLEGTAIHRSNRAILESEREFLCLFPSRGI
jgi:hypothetical protein